MSAVVRTTDRVLPAKAARPARAPQRLNPQRTDTELGRMAGAFDAMLDSLEDAASDARRSEERMREFLADISHELRTPVAGLVASAERLLREGSVRDPEHERLLVAMVRSSSRAARLIDDLLTLGRLEQDDALLWWREADLFTAMHRDARIALDILPSSGNRVELPWSSQVHAWFWVLVNIRFAHGVSSDLPDIARCPEWELPAGKLDVRV